eukprot:917548-Rhodomonas_salina.2
MSPGGAASPRADRLRPDHLPGAGGVRGWVPSGPLWEVPRAYLLGTLLLPAWSLWAACLGPRFLKMKRDNAAIEARNRVRASYAFALKKVRSEERGTRSRGAVSGGGTRTEDIEWVMWFGGGWSGGRSGNGDEAARGQGAASEAQGAAPLSPGCARGCDVSF